MASNSGGGDVDEVPPGGDRAAGGRAGDFGGGGGGHASSSSSSAAGPAFGQELDVYDHERIRLMEEQAEREQIEKAMIQAVLGSVFSTRKPRDVVAGTSSGLKTMTKGIGLGLAALVAQPYLGAKHSGAKGFVKGVGAGLATCTAATVAGTVVGTGQIVRGVLNTPRAIIQKSRGQIWNSEARKWEVDWYSLPEEAAAVLGETIDGSADGKDGVAAGSAGGAGSSSEPRRPAKKVVDRTYYDLLDVPPEATDAEIRKAFYKKSLALHPDKNPNNPEATAKFQAVSDAYRVLGDEERRRAYDEHGKDSAAAGLPKIEPVVFFAALFGSHHFEPIIGRLRLAQEIDGDLQSLLRDAATSLDEESASIDVLKIHRAQQQMKKVERMRQVRLAVDLAKRLEPMVIGLGDDPTGESKECVEWVEVHRAEAERLAKTPCGTEMLFLIGWIYANRARQFFAGSMLTRIVAQVEGSMHLVQTKAQLASTVGKTAYTVNGAMKSAEKKKLGSGKEDDGAVGDGAAAGKQASTASDGAEQAANPGDASTTPSEEGAAAGKKETQAEVPTPEPSKATKPDPSRNYEEDGAAGGKAKEAGPSKVAGQTSPPPAQAPGGSASAPEKANLLPGTFVLLSGLVGAAELNNEVGVVCGFDPEADRYFVQVMPDVGLKKLKRENLVVIEDRNADSETDGPSGQPESSAGTGANSDDAQWANGDDDLTDAFKDCMSVFHDTAWGVTKLDIEFTLDKVVMKVLKDMSVGKDLRKKRAGALLKLGTIYQEPMKEKRSQRKSFSSESSAVEPAALPPSPTSGTTTTTTATTNPASSAMKMLARFRPRAPWKPSEAQKTQRAKKCEEKQKRMQAALEMMAAGASTEDVDDMIAARAAMEAETGKPFMF